MEPGQVQGHFHTLLHLDPGHGAVTAEGPDPDLGGIYMSTDGVSHPICTALSLSNLPQSRGCELQLQANALMSPNIPDEGSVEDRQF